MTVSEVQTDEDLRRREFPVTRDKIFLAHAGVCPLPRRVAAAIADCAARSTLGDQEEFMLSSLERARELAARLIHCQAPEIALVGPTSMGLSFVAAGLKFTRGDNVLIYHDDYPANVYPWMSLAERNVEVRLLNTRGLGMIRARDVCGQIDENTRLVALASCHFISGFRIEIGEIGKQLRERGILFCLDAIQTLGAFPTTVEHVDFLAADSHKWLLGPCGAGIFYARGGLQETLNPSVWGWHNILSPNFVAQEKIEFQKDARKFEAGTHNLLGVSGLIAALELVLEVGVENIATDLVRKRQWLAPELEKRGFTVLNPTPAPENQSGIIAFFAANRDMPSLHKKFHDAGIVASPRVDRSGQNYIRISPHFYNTDDELRKVLGVLDS
ncbi:MAG: aminotransferase class V-fold PLP-dependent enzyme [Limisphaerales bacterium]